MDEDLFYGNMEDFFDAMESAEGKQMHACFYTGNNKFSLLSFIIHL